MGIPPNAANRDGGRRYRNPPPIGSNGVGELTAMIATMTTTTAGAIDRLIATITDKSRAPHSGLLHLLHD